MTFTGLAEGGASDNERRAYLVDGGTTPTTIRIPKNLKDAAAEAATLHGQSFSSYVRTCLIDRLVDGE